MSTDQDRAGYTAGLRALADILDQHPEIPLPYEGRLGTISWPVYDGGAERLAAIARVVIPGRREKDTSLDGYFKVIGKLHGLSLEVWSTRQLVCERIVTGTREVTREVPDPEALAAVPTVTVTETVEDVTWECAPLLAGEAEAVPA